MIQDHAILKTENGKRYFDLSVQGQQLYKQLSSNNTFGKQSFLVRKGESIQVSGLIAKVDNMDLLQQCPLGGSGVVTQLATQCVKRFSRTFTYSEVVSSGTMSLSLRDLAASTDLGTTEGCDIDLSTTISNQ